MNRTTALACAAILAVLSAVLLQRSLAGRAREDAEATRPIQVVAAERDIPPGTPLTRDDIMPIPIPQSALAPSTIAAEHGPALLGRTLLRARRQGEQLSWFDVQESGRGLAAAIPSGERAVTVSVDDRSGLSGMLRPNDRVDVLWISSQPPPREGAPERASARLLLADVTVLAAGTRTGQDVPGDETGYATVTLACPPEEAAALALAQARGDLVLVLRNPGDHGGTTPFTIDEPALSGDLARRRQERIEILRRGVKE